MKKIARWALLSIAMIVSALASAQTPYLCYGDQLTDGREMVQDENADASGIYHYRYKGLLTTPITAGIFLNVKIDGTYYGPALGTASGSFYVKNLPVVKQSRTVTNSEVVELNPLTNATYGYAVTGIPNQTPETMRPAMLDVDVWKDGEVWKMQVATIHGARVMVTGTLNGANWTREDNVESTYLDETEAGSLIFKGRIRMCDTSYPASTHVKNANGTFCFFAPRYLYRGTGGDTKNWAEQRIGGVGKLQLTPNEVSTGDLLIHGDYGFQIETGTYGMKDYQVTLDLSHTDVADDNVKLQDLTDFRGKERPLICYGGRFVSRLEHNDLSVFGREMVVEGSNPHHRYKGYFNTPIPEGIFINFRSSDGNHIYGPAPSSTVPSATSGYNVKTITFGETYDVVEIQSTDPAEQYNDNSYGFALQREEDGYDAARRPAFLDVELWEESGVKKMKVTKIATPRVFAYGTFVDNVWGLEGHQGDGKHKDIEKCYFKETEPGSLIFQGRVNIARDEGHSDTYGSDIGCLIFFAPRYYAAGSDDREQRIGGKSDVTQDAEGNYFKYIWQEPYSSAKDEAPRWQLPLSQHNAQRGWVLPVGETLVTLDLSHADAEDNGLMYIPIQTVTVNKDIQYATFAPRMNVSPEVEATKTGATVLYVTNRDEDWLLTTPEVALTTEQSIAQNEGLLVHSTSNEDNTVTFFYSRKTTQPLEGNWLKGVQEETTKPSESDGAVYLLSKKNGVVKFYRWGTAKLPAYKSYLKVTGAGLAPEFLSFGEETGIQTLPEATQEAKIYNLSGQRINHMQRGVNIVNGKKVLY